MTEFLKEREHVAPQELRGYLTAVLLAKEREAGKLPANSQTQLANRQTIGMRLLALLQEEQSAAPPSAASAQMTAFQLMQEGTAIFSRVQALQSQVFPGTVSKESLRAFEAVVSDYKVLIDGAAPDNSALPSIYDSTAGAIRLLAGCYKIVGRNSEALSAYREAATYFTKAGDKTEADSCLTRADQFEQQLSRDLDRTATKPLATLNQNTAPSDPFAPIAALMQLADVAQIANDLFEANEKADAAAETLKRLGYQDPADCGPETAMDSWITAATGSLTGTPLLARISQVGIWYDEILSHRYAVQVTRDRSIAEKLEALKWQLDKMLSQLSREGTAAEADLMSALDRFFPGSHPKLSEAPDNRSFELAQEANRLIDEALSEVTNACNQRLNSGDPMNDLLDTLHHLQERANGMNSPLYQAKTRLAEAYVLQRTDRNSDVVKVAQDARTRLLDGRPESLSSLPQPFERYYYLESLNYEMLGQMMSGHPDAGLEIAEATVKDYESERYSTHTDYRQSAMVSSVADFYKWGAFAAFKLEKWDRMLQLIDLVKARAAVRNRLTPDPPDFFDSDLARQFDQVSQDLAATPGDAALEARRRETWDMLSIARAQTGSAIQTPEVTVKSLQAALAPDEAMLAFFWFHETVLLTVAMDSTRFQADRILLEPEQKTGLDDFIAFVQKLTRSQRAMDGFAAKLGEILLPVRLREFVRNKKRIIFSPHHSLHLFPFHAARWDDGFVGTEFAVSYVPNFSAILLPWDKQPENRFLGVAIGAFADPAINPLPNVEDDVRAIRGFYEAEGTGVTTLLGREATRENLDRMRRSGELSKFRTVHLGTHGLSVFATPNQPLESQLKMQDGALDAMDISNLRLNAEVAVLSACHSGQRAIQFRNFGEVPGDEIFGIQSALFKSGVRSILGTLWLVETESASAITREFHRHLAAGEPADVALQLAVKLYLLSGTKQRSIYYWAPFFISSLGVRPKENQTNG